ncbi:glycerophosphoryl diester phosphodiesterase membrane domain-containing protein [Streptomyces nodosus]|uniref:Membrane protein n=1 Tax=Streptomyces nodosus TaxID=40318 RepID=A0A0B5DLT0_9ACTN|nr:glycerophosphoryl diester phosphodiesterase membrane domain-containing protein [Streptomyces nodosus]AJE40972.1 membrane protein [Streptomyces nodosus]MBB4792079.1 hypothetical protein [Streptomyces nodosus]QEV39515.1 hypothetical protein CP978_13945 [Streptomyces nodosus]
MEDTPGWASPGSGSAPSDRQQPGASGAQPPQQPSGQGDAEQGAADGTRPPANWSAEQPPPGQWAAPPAQGPGAPPPPPGGGWGAPPPPPGGYPGPGGWGGPGPGGYGAWGPPPPAAKPGVIPLRPLGLGEILDGAISTMRVYWRQVFGLTLTVAVATQVLVILFQKVLLDDGVTTVTSFDGSDAAFRELAATIRTVMVGSVLVGLVSLLGTLVTTALLTTITSRAVLGRPVTTGEAWREARPQLFRLLGLTLLLPLISIAIVAVCALPGLVVMLAGQTESGGGLALFGVLVGLPLSLWISIRLSLASPALMLEKQTVRKAMGRSVKLVRGSWWRTFGIQVLAQIIAFFLSMVVAIPFTLISGVLDAGGRGGPGWTFLIITGIGSVIGRILSFPFTAGVIVLLYIDQRIRREGLDLDLARSAGPQGHGGTAPSPATWG